MFDAYPFIASSIELSRISQTRWCRPAAPTPPMYMPGRLRTGSRPSRTVMSFAVYAIRTGFYRVLQGSAGFCKVRVLWVLQVRWVLQVLIVLRVPDRIAVPATFVVDRRCR